MPRRECSPVGPSQTANATRRESTTARSPTHLARRESSLPNFPRTVTSAHHVKTPSPSITALPTGSLALPGPRALIMHDNTTQCNKLQTNAPRRDAPPFNAIEPNDLCLDSTGTSTGALSGARSNQQRIHVSLFLCTNMNENMRQRPSVAEQAAQDAPTTPAAPTTPGAPAAPRTFRKGNSSPPVRPAHLRPALYPFLHPKGQKLQTTTPMRNRVPLGAVENLAADSGSDITTVKRRSGNMGARGRGGRDCGRRKVTPLSSASNTTHPATGLKLDSKASDIVLSETEYLDSFVSQHVDLFVISAMRRPNLELEVKGLGTGRADIVVLFIDEVFAIMHEVAQ